MSQQAAWCIKCGMHRGEPCYMTPSYQYRLKVRRSNDGKYPWQAKLVRGIDYPLWADTYKTWLEALTNGLRVLREWDV